MERQFIPLVLMLIGGGITCIFTLLQNYSLTENLISILVVMLVLFLLGSLLVYFLDYFERTNQKREEAQRMAEEEEKRLLEEQEKETVALKEQE